MYLKFSYNTLKCTSKGYVYGIWLQLILNQNATNGIHEPIVEWKKSQKLSKSKDEYVNSRIIVAFHHIKCEHLITSCKKTNYSHNQHIITCSRKKKRLHITRFFLVINPTKVNLSSILVALFQSPSHLLKTLPKLILKQWRQLHLLPKIVEIIIAIIKDET
jgi:hypothetical protein